MISQVICFHADKTASCAYENESSLTSPAGRATVAGVEAAGGGRRRDIGDVGELHPLSRLAFSSNSYQPTTALKWKKKKTQPPSQAIYAWPSMCGCQLPVPTKSLG